MINRRELKNNIQEIVVFVLVAVIALSVGVSAIVRSCLSTNCVRPAFSKEISFTSETLKTPTPNGVSAFASNGGITIVADHFAEMDDTFVVVGASFGLYNTSPIDEKHWCFLELSARATDGVDGFYYMLYLSNEALNYYNYETAGVLAYTVFENWFSSKKVFSKENIPTFGEYPYFYIRNIRSDSVRGRLIINSLSFGFID